MRPLRNTERVLNNPAVERLLEKEKSLGKDLSFEDIMEEVSGVYPKVMTDGEVESGAWSCGMVAGLIHDIPSCEELVQRIMSEADALIRNRLEGLLEWTAAGFGLHVRRENSGKHNDSRKDAGRGCREDDEQTVKAPVGVNPRDKRNRGGHYRKGDNVAEPVDTAPPLTGGNAADQHIVDGNLTKDREHECHGDPEGTPTH